MKGAPHTSTSGKRLRAATDSGAPNELVAVELCAGLGGIGIALRELGYHVERAYDSWKVAVDVYNENAAEPVAAQCDLVSDQGRRMVARDLGNASGLDLLAAGPPCKGFSRIRNGQRSGSYQHNRVLYALPDYVAMLRPRIVLIENVPELMLHWHGRTFRNLVCRLQRPGPRKLRYCVQYHTYDAAMYGTPQTRRRLIILAVREGDGAERLPTPGPDASQLFASLRHGGKRPKNMLPWLDVLRDERDATMVTAWQALSDLPGLGAGSVERPRSYRLAPQNAYQRWVRRGAPKLVTCTSTPGVMPATVDRLRHIPPGGCARDIPLRFLNGLDRRFDSAYRRLHPNAPSTALSTKYDCVYHHSRSRSLSVREYARLQGIPDSVDFPAHLACRRFAYELIGNSVPPPFALRLLREVLC